jgi:molecular chaperone GrpE
MSSRKKKAKRQPEHERPIEVEEPAAGEAEGSAESTETPTDSAEAAQTEAAPTTEQELERLRDENLRLMAELRNVQQRAQRERQEALRYAEADFARDLLVILDDLERTQESARSAEDVKAVGEGVRIVYEHFLKVLRGRHIEPIEALGRPFDPDLHEALMQRPHDDQPAGTVIQELARGYRMRERVIRPSKVIVSSGPPAAPGPEAPDEDQGESDADV